MVVQVILDLKLLDSDRVNIWPGFPRVFLRETVFPSNLVLAVAGGSSPTCSQALHLMFALPFTATYLTTVRQSRLVQTNNTIIFGDLVVVWEVLAIRVIRVSFCHGLVLIIDLGIRLTNVPHLEIQALCLYWTQRTAGCKSLVKQKHWQSAPTTDRSILHNQFKELNGCRCRFWCVERTIFLVIKVYSSSHVPLLPKVNECIINDHRSGSCVPSLLEQHTLICTEVR